MKRTALQRKAPLARGSKPLERRTPLAQGETPLRAKPKPKPTVDEQSLMAAFHAFAKAMARGSNPKPTTVPICAACGKPAPERDDHFGGHAHHVISQQELRNVARQRGIAELPLVWERRNALWLCHDCHFGHHHTGGDKRLSRRVLTVPNLCFASDMGLEHYIERYYRP
jgi:hypothetical protein